MGNKDPSKPTDPRHYEGRHAVPDRGKLKSVIRKMLDSAARIPLIVTTVASIVTIVASIVTTLVQFGFLPPSNHYRDNASGQPRSHGTSTSENQSPDRVGGPLGRGAESPGPSPSGGSGTPSPSPSGSESPSPSPSGGSESACPVPSPSGGSESASPSPSGGSESARTEPNGGQALQVQHLPGAAPRHFA